MSRTILIVAAALSLAACAQQARLERAGTTGSQYDRDHAQCKYEAEKAMASAPRCLLCEVGSSGDLIVDAVAGKPSDRLAKQCMALRGYK